MSPQPESRHIGVVTGSAAVWKWISKDDVLYAVKACAAQLQQVAEAYDEKPWTIDYYDTVDGIDTAEVWPVYLDDGSGHQGSHAIHYNFGGLIGGRVDVTDNPLWTVHLSHEACEIARNPHVSIWMQAPDGYRWAYEICDPVQDDWYSVDVELFGLIRQVKVSNFVLPSFWTDGSFGPWDRMGRLIGPYSLSMGGYIPRKKGFVTENYWGFASSSMRASKFHELSRTSRIMRGEK